MEIQDSTINTICRVCLNHEELDKMVSLIDNSQVTGLSFFGSTLEEICKIPVKQNQYLPLHLCQKCKQSLEGAKRFIIACGLSDRKLSKLIEFSRNQDLDDDMVKEVIRQFTLFSQNFPETSKTLRQSSSSHLDMITTQHKTEGKSPKIKVETDVPTDNSSNFFDFDYENNDRNLSPIETDVDIFIHSINRLINESREYTTTETKVTPCKKITTESIIEQNGKISPEDEKDLTCNICQKVLATKKTLKHHIERHGVCRFVCDQCGKYFPINAELVQHQIHSHGASSQYECDICSYRAVKKIQLIEHIRLHTGERPFTCEKCGLTFRRKTLYNKHAKFHGDRMIQCDYCPRKFYVRSAMLAHRNSRHNREFFYTCTICNVTYAMAKTVKKHMLEKHGIPRHMQGKVQKTYKIESADNLQKSVGDVEFIYS